MPGTRLEDAHRTRGRRSTRRRWWLIIAVAVLMVGLALSAVSAELWRKDERRDQRRAFALTSANVTATLGTLLHRDADFVATLRAVLTMQHPLSATEFYRWYRRLQGSGRRPGAIGTAVIASVPASQAPSFEARRDADPAFRALVDNWLAPVVRGSQAQYCLMSGGADLVPLAGVATSLVQQDWCAPESLLGSYQSSLLKSAADTGELLAVPVDVASLHTMFLEAAFYRIGVPLRTVRERRAAVIGWLVTSFDMPTVIRAAIGYNHNLSVALYHTNPGQPEQLVGSGGDAPRSAQLTQRTAMSIDGSWSVVVRGAPVTSGPSVDLQSMLDFAAGGLSSVLLAVLVFTLARGRERALAMVAEKTRELRHQALHDALTGLPNRVLAIDRAEQMLGRARRTQAPIVALYIDIDAFKLINDTFGHASGDRFLQIVAARLRSVLRTGDTAARLAGDEFLVLVECSNLAGGPQALAHRLLEVLREPYELNRDAAAQLSMTASIGVAYGQRFSAEELLADADAALYVAKAAGKNRFAVFHPGLRARAASRADDSAVVTPGAG